MSSDEAARYLERQRPLASGVVTVSSTITSTQRRALKEGEWACVDAKCAYINSDRHVVCDRCGKSNFFKAIFLISEMKKINSIQLIKKLILWINLIHYFGHIFPITIMDSFTLFGLIFYFIIY